MPNLTTEQSTVPQNAPECPTEENHLHEKQRDSIEMLVLGRSFTAVAGALQIDRKTLYRWRRDPEFAGELARRKQEVWSEAADRVRAMVNRSLDVMEQHLADNYDRSRFRAASVILRLSNLGKCAARE